VRVSRPVATAAAALLAGCGRAEPGVEAESELPRVAEGCVPEDVAEGANAFVQVGCLGCHTYDGEGSTAVDAPDLTAIGEFLHASRGC
jgi:hypothetical protein